MQIGETQTDGQADEGTDEHDEANRRFSRLCEPS
jgi:hypothetical protein